MGRVKITDYNSMNTSATNFFQGAKFLSGNEKGLLLISLSISTKSKSVIWFRPTLRATPTSL